MSHDTRGYGTRAYTGIRLFSSALTPKTCTHHFDWFKLAMAAANSSEEPRRGLGQFWSNNRAEREVWAKPIESHWFQLAPFFQPKPDGAALSAWLSRRWDGSNPFCPPVNINEDDRALGLACGIRGIPERVRNLIATTVVPHGTLARDPQIQQLTHGIQKEMIDNKQLVAASLRLADTWAIASATNDLGEFEQNLAAMIYFIHLLLVRSPQYL